MNSPLVQTLEGKAAQYVDSIDSFFTDPLNETAKAKFSGEMKLLNVATNQRKAENGTAAQFLKAAAMGVVPAERAWQDATGRALPSGEAVAEFQPALASTQSAASETAAEQSPPVTRPNTRRSKNRR